MGLGTGALKSNGVHTPWISVEGHVANIEGTAAIELDIVAARAKRVKPPYHPCKFQSLIAPFSNTKLAY